jgi:hypothetical protein
MSLTSESLLRITPIAREYTSKAICCAVPFAPVLHFLIGTPISTPLIPVAGSKFSL